MLDEIIQIDQQLNKFTIQVINKGNKMIIDNDSYKLKLTVKQIKPNQQLVTIGRWIPETDWVNLQLFLSDSELELMKQSLNGELHG